MCNYQQLSHLLINWIVELGQAYILPRRLEPLFIVSGKLSVSESNRTIRQTIRIYTGRVNNKPRFKLPGSILIIRVNSIVYDAGHGISISWIELKRIGDITRIIENEVLGIARS